jgi:hypothetical protein
VSSQLSSKTISRNTSISSYRGTLEPEATLTIHLELDGLNLESAELAEVIAKNFEELLG